MKRDLFITKKCEVKRVGNTINVIGENQTRKVPISVISNLFIFGNSKITQGAKNFLLRNGIDIYFLSTSGSLNGILSSTKLNSNYKNRLKQYQAYQNPFSIAKLFVLEKIKSIEKVLNRSLNRYTKKVENVDNLDSLRGVEGAVSLYLFKKLREDLKSVGIEFERRSYNPPKDEVNSLLSLVYTLYYGYLYSIVLSSGLDPYIGFLHQKRGTHAPFVSDLMEPQRAKLTNFVAELFLKREVTLKDFDSNRKLKNEKLGEIISKYSKEFIFQENRQKELKEFLECIIKEF